MCRPHHITNITLYYRHYNLVIYCNIFLQYYGFEGHYNTQICVTWDMIEGGTKEVSLSLLSVGRPVSVTRELFEHNPRSGDLNIVL